MVHLVGFTTEIISVEVLSLAYVVYTQIKVKWSRYGPGMAQRVGTGIALLFHDRGTRRGWVVSSMPRLHFTPRKDPAPIVQEAGWAPGLVWTGRKSRPNRDSILDHPARSQSLYQLSYPHIHTNTHLKCAIILSNYMFQTLLAWCWWG